MGRLTVQTLENSVPVSMPGVTFLNEINKIDRKGPWSLTFSFSRANQSSALKAWDGKKENVEAAQKALLARVQANSEASEGKYIAGSQPSSFESLYVKDYVY